LTGINFKRENRKYLLKERVYKLSGEDVIRPEFLTTSSNGSLASDFFRSLNICLMIENPAPP